MAMEMGGSNGNPSLKELGAELGLGEDAQQMIEQTKEAVSQAMEGAAEFIRERPIVCLAGALAIGYLVGKIVSR